MAEDLISIKESDLPSEEYLRLKNWATEMETLLDSEKNIWITLGLPQIGENTVDVPNKPHVFIADQLRVFDNNHPLGLLLENIMVLIAHAHRSPDDKWIFANGQNIADTVTTWNGYAIEKHLPTVDFVVACNQYPTNEGIEFLEFGGLESNTTITYSIGSNVRFGGNLQNGRVIVSAALPEGNFYNLESLIAAQQVKIL